MTARRAQYLDLADALLSRWEGLAPGSPVESEHQIAAEFGVNRLTARETLRELERRLIVRRVAGSGTFTAHRLDYRVELGEAPSFRRVVTTLGHRPGVEQLGAGWQGRGQLRELVIRRVLTVDGLVSSVASDRFPRSVGERVSSPLSGAGSVVDALRSTGSEPYRSDVRVSMALPDDVTSTQLGFSGPPSMVWRLESTTTDGPGGPVIHRSESWMRPDMFALTVNLGNPRGR